MTQDLIARAKELMPKERTDSLSGRKPASLDEVRKILNPAQVGLDVYLCFDTTGSMNSYIAEVVNNLEAVTDVLLKENHSAFRLSINGVGDHCDGEDCLQMYALSSNPEEVRGAIESIEMTNGGDAPEAYECLALALSKRIPQESFGRKKAVVLVADSIPHGMVDEECPHAGSYQNAFEALKILSDSFYFVGCNPQAYRLQEQLINPNKKDKEQFIPLGDMVGVLPELLTALAKKTESEKALQQYLKSLELAKPESAKKIYGLLTAGK